MAIEPRIGSYLNLEKVRVSKDPKNSTIHITSKDPDIPGGFHISLNSGTETETKLRNLLDERIGDRFNPSDIPHYEQFYQDDTQMNNISGIIRSVNHKPKNLRTGVSTEIPLGVHTASEGSDEIVWDVEEQSNLFVLEPRAIEIAKQHVDYWNKKDGSWELFVTSKPPYSHKSSESFYDLIKSRTKTLRDLGVEHINQLQGTENQITRTLIVYKGRFIDISGNGISLSNVNDGSNYFNFKDSHEMRLAFAELGALGIHFVADISRILDSRVKDDSQILEINIPSKNSFLVHVEMNIAYSSDSLEMIEKLGYELGIVNSRNITTYY